MGVVSALLCAEYWRTSHTWEILSALDISSRISVSQQVEEFCLSMTAMPTNCKIFEGEAPGRMPMAASEDHPLSRGSSTVSWRGEITVTPLAVLLSTKRRSARAPTNLDAAPPPRAQT